MQVWSCSGVRRWRRHEVGSLRSVRRVCQHTHRKSEISAAAEETVAVGAADAGAGRGQTCRGATWLQCVQLRCSVMVQSSTVCSCNSASAVTIAFTATDAATAAGQSRAGRGGGAGQRRAERGGAKGGGAGQGRAGQRRAEQVPEQVLVQEQNKSKPGARKGAWQSIVANMVPKPRFARAAKME